jgi:uncharacterized RDD family membrane protein YckC
MDTDRIEITTPEGLSLAITLAGLGSRAAAAIIDTLIIAVLIAVAIVPFGSTPGTAIRIFQIAMPFALFFGYHMVFETIGRRQSPGKRLLGLRIVKTDGSPARGVDSVIRNLIRLVDFLPSFYLIGIISVFATSQNQRLGDLAAGVVVVTEPNPGAGLFADDQPPPFRLPEGWDVSAVTDQDVAVMRQFLARRASLDRTARLKLANKISTALERKVSRPGQQMTAEVLIEIVFELKRRKD